MVQGGVRCRGCVVVSSGSRRELTVIAASANEDLLCALNRGRMLLGARKYLGTQRTIW